ncbi:hypothetical protein AB0A74_07020 [Saccharothrix sp. NPDC042600]|uniref:hypothetical protein n=1 Tax=Saccharothrix TaxID=2071 RepID=UPI0034063A14|nr:hypothetical protein GCM10017745_30730 [Saccharothrix mutabilis subsp. capreolus]
MPTVASLPIWAFLTFTVLVMLFALVLVALVVRAPRMGTEIKVSLLPPKIEIRTITEPAKTDPPALEGKIKRESAKVKRVK